MKTYKYVIIGGGTTAGYAAQEFVDHGLAKGELCIISAEIILPMNRPPLSKKYLQDSHQDNEILINNDRFYKTNGIDVMIRTCVRSIDYGKSIIELDNGEDVKYGKLLIAIGSKLKRLTIPGSNLENIFYLRNIGHADKIREQARRSKRAIVIGGGYIGSETAASLSKLGLQVSLIVSQDHLLAKFTNTEIATYLSDVFTRHGVRLIFDEKVVAFHGDKNVFEAELASGKRLPADMVVVGVGVQPNIKLVAGTALNVSENGIVVNEFCETNIKNVYAAGDVTEFPDQIFGVSRHVDHWENALEQGKNAARSMMGIREPYVFVPYFFSDLFDLSYEYFGDQSAADYSVTRGNSRVGNFSHWWFNGNRLVAAFIMSKRPEEESNNAREWIRMKKNIDKYRIHDSDVKLKSLILN